MDSNIKDLNRIERLAKKKQHYNEAGYGTTGMTLAHHGRVVLCGDMSDYQQMHATRTHNIALYDKHLWWENNNSKSWSYHFETLEDAKTWWNKTFPTCGLLTKFE
jgi:hypothetical protein